VNSFKVRELLTTKKQRFFSDRLCVIDVLKESKDLQVFDNLQFSGYYG